MSVRANAFLRHQQARWLRPDAARWVRPDAAKFLKPGSDVADVYPALAQRRDREFADAIAQEQTAFAALRAELDIVVAELARRKAERKYNADQPRVPSGNSDGGQWTSGDGGSGRPRVYITGRPDDDTGGGFGDSGGFGVDFGNVIGDVFSDIASEIDKLDLFDIKPKKPRTGGVRLAGKPPERLPEIVVTPGEVGGSAEPGIGHNGGPPLEDPPDIPRIRPSRSRQRTAVQRAIGFWIGRAINAVFSFAGRAIARRARLLLKVFVTVVSSIPWLQPYRPQIETYRDPPRTMDQLQKQIGKPGYQRHHIAEEAAARDFGDPENLIQGIDNLAGVPTLKHIEITAEYNRKVEQPDGRMRSPRELLKEADFETRREYGLNVLRRHGVLK